MTLIKKYSANYVGTEMLAVIWGQAGILGVVANQGLFTPTFSTSF